MAEADIGTLLGLDGETVFALPNICTGRDISIVTVPSNPESVMREVAIPVKGWKFMPKENQDITDRLEAAGILDHALASQAASEIRRLRRDVEGVDRVLTDCQSESTAFLRGVEKGHAAALRSILEVLRVTSPAMHQAVLRRCQNADVAVEPRSIKLAVDNLEVVGDIHKLTKMTMDGRPRAGLSINIRLDIAKASAGVTLDERAELERLFVENQELREQVNDFRDAVAMEHGPGRPESILREARVARGDE